MIAFIARRHEPASLSHWGQFECLGDKVTVKATDLGLIDEEYTTLFEFDGKQFYSRLLYDPRLAGNQMHDRLANDDMVLWAHGIDPTTIEFLD